MIITYPGRSCLLSSLYETLWSFDISFISVKANGHVFKLFPQWYTYWLNCTVDWCRCISRVMLCIDESFISRQFGYPVSELYPVDAMLSSMSPCSIFEAFWNAIVKIDRWSQTGTIGNESCPIRIIDHYSYSNIIIMSNILNFNSSPILIGNQTETNLYQSQLTDQNGLLRDKNRYAFPRNFSVTLIIRKPANSFRCSWLHWWLTMCDAWFHPRLALNKGLMRVSWKFRSSIWEHLEMFKLQSKEKPWNVLQTASSFDNILHLYVEQHCCDAI